MKAYESKGSRKAGRVVSGLAGLGLLLGGCGSPEGYSGPTYAGDNPNGIIRRGHHADSSDVRSMPSYPNGVPGFRGQIDFGVSVNSTGRADSVRVLYVTSEAGADSAGLATIKSEALAAAKDSLMKNSYRTDRREADGTTVVSIDYRNGRTRFISHKINSGKRRK
ncbi:hypothetical protein ACFLQN_02570 [Candidatus Aenigmatarchaeota archaeon]